MANSVALFRSYIIFILLFLAPLSLLITRQIFFILKEYIFIYNLADCFRANKSFMPDYKAYISLFNSYIVRKKFFLSISLSEFYIRNCPSQSYLIYASLAYCYQKNNFLYIAEYYYLIALSLSNKNKFVLFNLLEIYIELDSYDKIAEVKNQIATLGVVGYE
uniref:Uncharacterized protein n=1 Tax=Laurenciella marilzae TaxID=1413812 RepID=A0A1Z1M1P0_9FLOR|nr:hypothetical protein [Laurenciella marilzae]ARW59694.1 hypothetical protein [Laurenciella marilzae]